MTVADRRSGSERRFVRYEPGCVRAACGQESGGFEKLPETIPTTGHFRAQSPGTSGPNASSAVTVRTGL